jgi:hypothetical protein
MPTTNKSIRQRLRPQLGGEQTVGQTGIGGPVTDPTTGRVMEVLSTEPGVQFYTGNFLDGSITGKGGWVYQNATDFCFEPQHYPDSPNHPQFPSAELKPGQTYQNTIIYRFSVRHKLQPFISNQRVQLMDNPVTNGQHGC